MNFLENIRKKSAFGVISLQYLPFHVQSCASKNCFIKSRLYNYMPQICGVAKKSKTF